MTVERFRNLTVTLAVLALGVAITGYFSAYLKRDELRPWQKVYVVFADVGGLKVKDPVRLNGARIGRVSEIRLHKGRQRATLEVEPELKLYSEGIKAEIVPINALGRVAIDLQPGREGSALVDGDIAGQIRPALGGGGGTPTPGRRKEIAKQLQDLADAGERAANPESGTVGSLLFDPARAREMSDGLKALSKLWKDVDEGLAQTEYRSSEQGMLSRQSLLLALESSGNFLDTMRSFRDGLAPIRDGRGVAGRLLADPNAARDVRHLLKQTSTSWTRTRSHQDTLGRLLDPNKDASTQLGQAIRNAREVTAKGDAGEGTLGTLSSPELGGSVAESLRGMEATFRRLSESEALRSTPNEQDQTKDALSNLDDLILNLRRGIAGLRSGLPDKNFQGVVFSVF